MKKICLLAGLGLLQSFFLPNGFSQVMSLHEAVQASARYLEQNLPKGLKVAILEFTSPSEPLSNYVIEELAGALVNGGRLTVVDRRDIDLIRREMEFQLSGNVRDESVKQLGVMLEADSIIAGALVNTGTNYRFRIHAINVESSVLEASIPLTISGKDEQTYFLLTGQRYPPPASPTIPKEEVPLEPPPPANFARIPGGSFMMGSPLSEPQRNADELRHQVIIGGFYMGKYEVTQQEYEEVMGTLPPVRFRGPNMPVENVSWYDAIEYCNRRSEAEGFTPAYSIDPTRSDGNNLSGDDLIRWVVTWNTEADGYRLPTEAEWEYACRAGTAGPFSTGMVITPLLANYDGNYPYNTNPKGVYRDKTTGVGSFPPNAWGLHDMHGNVREWCWDWYAGYGPGSQSNSTGPGSGGARIIRGGSWYTEGRDLRSARRDSLTPSFLSADLGFRVVRSLF
ncbi:MAG: SUMF1/EgtB/PvdO family nonheme iron enzyme [Spirochaetaceae bacterium]|jgi:formylglycine-generating enzyme required for sulfatase activity|nr:SUMF1/EgtB/PvdO family nonheme iron enzyme [Spirochaetaceae bacterium]